MGRKRASGEGYDFVRCRVCGDHRRVISGRHLSKHEIDRETYMAEYRLSPDQLIAKDFRRIQSSLRGYEPYGKSDWATALKAVYKKTGNIHAGFLQKHYPHIYEQGVWIHGDWDKALSSGGFNPDTMRQRRFWNDDKLGEGIYRLRRRGLPLYPAYVMKFYPGLFARGLRQFKTWNKVLGHYGLPKIQTGQKPRLRILRALRDIRESKSAAEIPAALKIQAEYYFGTLKKAMAESKKDPRVVNGWSKAKIIASIIRMHRRGEDLSYTRMRKDVPALLSAAEAYFVTWGRALQQAGIDRNLYNKRRVPIKGRFRARRDRSSAEHQF